MKNSLSHAMTFCFVLPAIPYSVAFNVFVHIL